MSIIGKRKQHWWNKKLKITKRVQKNHNQDIQNTDQWNKKIPILDLI